MQQGLYAPVEWFARHWSTREDKGAVIRYDVTVPNSDTVHQSIFDFCRVSYITYHNGALSTGGPYRRSTCIDRLYYNDDGTIKTIVQTTL